MLWYKEYGFHGNPFSIKPGAFHYKVIGYDLEEVFEKIDKGQVIFIEGKYGQGKTTTLKHIISRFGGRKEVMYYNCNRMDDYLYVEKLLNGRFGMIGRLLNRSPKNMIVLLDEVEKLSSEDQKDILQNYSQGSIKSIIFFGPNFEAVGFTPELQKLMVNNVIQLTPLTDEEAILLVRERIGDLKLLPDDIIKEVFEHAQRNPRIMLESLEDLCRLTTENHEEEVTRDHLAEVLDIKKKKVKTKKRSKKPAVQKEVKTEPTPQEIAEDKTDSEYFY